MYSIFRVTFFPHRREANMITLDEILKNDEKEYIVPADIKERILANILEQIYNWMSQSDMNNG